MSKAAELAELLALRLAEVPGVVAVYRGRRHFNVEDLSGPIIILFEGDDKPEDSTSELVKLDQHYGAEWHGPCDSNNPNDAAHVAIAAMKKALWIRRDPMRGKMFLAIKYRGRIIGPREDGQSWVSVLMQFSVSYSEDLTDP